MEHYAPLLVFSHSTLRPCFNFPVLQGFLIRETVIGGICSTHDKLKNVYMISIGRHERERRRGWTENIKIDIGEMDWERWIGLK